MCIFHAFPFPDRLDLNLSDLLLMLLLHPLGPLLELLPRFLHSSLHLLTSCCLLIKLPLYIFDTHGCLCELCDEILDLNVFIIYSVLEL